MKDFKLEVDGKKVVEDSRVGGVIQQIDLLFSTTPKEVFGEPYFGADFYQFLYDLNASNSQVDQYISTLIRENVKAPGFDIQSHTYFLHGTPSDIILVEISIRDEYNEYKKTYKIG